MARGSKAKATKAAAAKQKKGKQETKAQAQQEPAEQQLETAADAAQHITAARQAVVGLSNLGNTCFLNSSVQLLLACAPLQQLVLQKDGDITRGPLGFALQQAALHAAGRSSTSKGGSNSTYNPQSLLSAVCCHAPVFKGKQQHDAHELMRMLLDGLQTQEQRYRELSRRSASKGLAGLPNGTAAANSHSSCANGAPDLARTSDSSSAASSSAADAAGPQLQNGTLPHGASSARSNTSSSASASSSSSSSDSSENDTAASAGDGLDALCQAYLTKPKPASLDGVEGFVKDAAEAEAAAAATASDNEAPPSVASSTAAEGGSAEDPSSSNSSEAAVDSQQDVALGEGAAAAPVNGVAAAAEAQGGLQQHTATEAASQRASTSTAGDAALANGVAASSSAGCRLCGNGFPSQQQSQQGQNPLARKSLLPPEPPKTAGASSVEAVFGGVLCSRITCTACGYCSISYEPFLDLSLPIPLGSGPEEGLVRKGSLLSRLANRTTGKKKAAAAAAAKDSADSSVDGGSSSNPAAGAADTAAAATAAADAAAEAAAAAAAAANEAQNKKMNHKEKRKLRAQATKAAREASKLARFAKKRQEEEQDDVSGHSGTTVAGQQSNLPAVLDPTLLEDIPPTNYYTQEQLDLMQKIKAAGGVTDQEQGCVSMQQQGEGSQPRAAADAQPPQQQSQQQQLQLQPLDILSDTNGAAGAGTSAGAAATPGHGADAVAVAVSQGGTMSDKGSAVNGWSDAGSADASPRTATVNCWGGGWVDLQSQRAAHAAPSSIASSQAQPPPSSSSGFVPSSSDGGAPAGGSDGGSSPKAATLQQQPRSTLHRRFGSLGNLSALTSGAKGGLSSLFTGRHSRQGSRDRDVLDKLAAAVAANGSSHGGVSAQLQRPQSAGVTSPSTEQRKGGLKGFLSRATTPPPPRPSSALGVVSEAGEAGVEGRAPRVSIPEDSPVDPIDSVGPVSISKGPWEPTEQQGQPGVFTPLGVAVNGGISVTTAGPGAGGTQGGASSTTEGPAAAAADGAIGGVPGGVPVVQPRRRLQRAFSDDAVMRLGSFVRSESSSSGSGAGEVQQQQLATTAAAAAATSSTASQLTADTAASGEHAHANGTLPVSAAGQLAAAASSNPFAAPAVQQQQEQDVLQATPAQQGQQQQAVPSVGVVPGAPAVAAGTDPFAAAAVVSKGEALAVKHCLATFFLREDVSWECPKEKALWKERRQSAASGRLSVDGGGASADGSGAGTGVCAACNQQPQQQGSVAIAAHPRLQQLIEGEEDEEGPVFKQVSFSEREPQVHFVPGSVEQRGTDMAAALAGRRPFCRALTCGGASLLLTAQLGEAPMDGAAAAGRQLTLTLKAAGEGGVTNTAAARVLPGGKGMLLGAVRLPDVQDLQLSADDCAALLSHWAQLVLSCMADLVHCEGGIAGLQAMVAGGLRLLSTEDEQSALRPGYVDSSSLEGRWKVRGQLPAAGEAVGEDLAAAAAGWCADSTPQQDHSQQQQLQAGYWEYPADDAVVADLAAAEDADGGLATTAVAAERGSGSDEAASLQAGSTGCMSPAASSASTAAAGSPAAANGNCSPGQQQQPGGSACQPWAEDPAVDGGDDMFAMDDEPQQECVSEQQEQGPQLQQPQGWQGDVLSSAGSSQLGGGKVLRSGSSLGSKDGEDSTSTSRSVPLFKKVPLAAAAAAADTAPASESTTVAAADADSFEEAGGSCGSNGSSSSAALVQSAPVAVPTAAASQPVNITPLQGSPPADANPADIAPGGIAAAGRTPPTGSTPGSLKRSSIRRRSSSCSRTAHKSYRIYLPPQVLLLHLKRFQHDGRGRLNKLDTAVKFEFELDLSSFMAGDAPGSSSRTAAVAAGADSGGSSGLQQQYQQLAPQESLKYDLVGLVVHMGTMRGGHYVAYVKRVLGSPSQGSAGEGSSNGDSSSGAGRVQWYYVSDTSVRAVDVTDVASAQAYMLLYVRRPGKQQQQQEAAAATVEQEQPEEHA